MKIFLSALSKSYSDYFIQQGLDKWKWNLLSYYQIKNSFDYAISVRDRSELIEIDSGAHSFQFGKKVDFLKYTEQYAEFIKAYDNDKVIGYFEMDIDNIVGYDKVKQLRKIIERVTDKCIPVWHINRGISEYNKMCEEYAGRTISITGFKNKDIKDNQYINFLKTAWKYNCKVHCLGMTRAQILDKVPFDYVDSASWLSDGIYGSVYNESLKKIKLSKRQTQGGLNSKKCALQNYKMWMQKQEIYYKKWLLFDKKKNEAWNNKQEL